jgi:hypothetical protein
MKALKRAADEQNGDGGKPTSKEAPPRAPSRWTCLATPVVCQEYFGVVYSALSALPAERELKPSERQSMKRDQVHRFDNSAAGCSVMSELSAARGRRYSEKFRRPARALGADGNFGLVGQVTPDSPQTTID